MFLYITFFIAAQIHLIFENTTTLGVLMMNLPLAIFSLIAFTVYHVFVVMIYNLSKERDYFKSGHI